MLDVVTLGDLDGVFPQDLVEAVLAKTQDREVRRRLLSPGLMVYFLLARALLYPQSYQRVLRTLVAVPGTGNGWDNWRVPDKAAIFRARCKLGIEPFHELLVHAGSAVADERTPGAFWRGLRVMALAGTTLQAADSPANQTGLGGPRAQRGERPPGGPLARLVALVESGSNVVCDAAVDSHRVKERVLAERLATSLGPAMLVLADRDLPCAHLWRRLADSGAELLWRVPKNWRPPVEETLPDGSWLSTVHGEFGRDAWPRQDARARVVEYARDAPGRGGAERCRLVTTLIDPHAAPAADLVALYGERAEAEDPLAELKTTQIGADTVLASKTPELVFQETYAHLAVYTGLRVLMHGTAVNRSEPLDPGRLSFTAALRAARRSLTDRRRPAPSLLIRTPVGGGGAPGPARAYPPQGDHRPLTWAAAPADR
ncbi:IS4 family transposase [Actinomadura chibensis]|nr:IS4 family transposase [Actinomadura chibensis]